MMTVSRPARMAGLAAIAMITLAACDRKEGPGPASGGEAEESGPLPAELVALNDRCRTSTTGTVIGLQALLAARHHPALAGLRRMNLDRYCSCYLRRLQRAVGTERTVAYSTVPDKLLPIDLVKTAQAADSVRLACAAAVAPPPGDDPFSVVFAAPFVTGRGIGGVELGIGVAELRRKLGETNLITRGTSDKYRYGENGIELVVDVFPSGDGGRVAGVRVNRSYQGATDRGFRVGDAYAAVEAKLTDIVFRADGKLLLTADGTKYFFDDGGSLDGIGVVTADVDPLMRSYGRR